MDFIQLLSGEISAQILVAAILSILFLQSGLDKIFDWGGNLSWLKDHFKGSPLDKTVPFLLLVITIFEVTSGVVSLIGAGFLLVTGQSHIALTGAQLSAVSIIMLFFGQRLAKDYTGAATLVPYFILAIIGILIFA